MFQNFTSGLCNDADLSTIVKLKPSIGDSQILGISSTIGINNLASTY